jgi:hypothetical protein
VLTAYIHIYIFQSVLVVFDGAQLDNRKLETSLDRARDSINKSSSTDQRVELSPLLLRQIFIRVLDTMEIPYVSALGEGDGECVSLANRFNCFLIAQDSDYFCYGLVRGYVPFDSVDMATTSYGSFRLTAQLYHIDSLLKQFFGLQHSTLALACCLCGNDYVSRDLTQSILNNLVHRVYMPPAFETNGNIQTKYLYTFMQWMRKFNHFDLALQQSCQLINSKSEQSVLQNKLRIAVQSYLIPPDKLINQFISPKNKNLTINSYFVQHARSHFNAHIDMNSWSITSNGGHPIPQFLCDAVCNLRLSPSFIEILIHRRLICKAHIEVEHELSIFEHAIPILLPCLAILLKWDGEYNDPLVDIYQRVRNQLQRCYYSVRDYIDNVPDLDKIQLMSRDERQRFVRKFLGLPNEPFRQWNHIHSDYHFWLMIIRYYGTSNVVVNKFFSMQLLFPWSKLFLSAAIMRLSPSKKKSIQYHSLLVIVKIVLELYQVLFANWMRCAMKLSTIICSITVLFTN